MASLNPRRSPWRQVALVSVVAVGAVAAVPALAGVADARPRVSVSQTSGLDPAGQVVVVSGSGFDESKGIYVTFCVLPPAGGVPSPCGGGGPDGDDSGSANWISSNPPSYGSGLAVPYDPGGSFTVSVRVQAIIPPDVDCRLVTCAITTRNDHVRSSDRSQDVFVPLTFRAEAPAVPPPTVPPPAVPPPTAPPPPEPPPPSSAEAPPAQVVPPTADAEPDALGSTTTEAEPATTTEAGPAPTTTADVLQDDRGEHGEEGGEGDSGSSAAAAAGADGAGGGGGWRSVVVLLGVVVVVAAAIGLGQRRRSGSSA